MRASSLVAASLLAAGASASSAGGASLCPLFASNKEPGFHFGRVDFAGKQLLDLVAMPPGLSEAGGGVAAGADDGQFFIPLTPGSNQLYELSLKTNKTILRTIAPPKEYRGDNFAFQTMQLNIATGDLWAMIQDYPTFVAIATIYPGNGTSVAISNNFASQIPSFDWIKTGVATVDSKRGIFYFVAGVGKNDVETLVGIAPGDPTAPVKFIEVPGPTDNSTDIDFLGYSPALDIFVASTAWIKTNIASIKIMPASGKGGAEWEDIYVWKPNGEADYELGNGALSADGLTFYVALSSGSTGAVQYFAFDLKAKKMTNSFTVPQAAWPGLVTAEVTTC